MDSEAQLRPPNPSPATGEGLDQTVAAAPAPEARPTVERKQRIQWGNFKGSQDILAAELPNYLGIETGKKEWVAELANKLVRDDTFMGPLTEKGHNAGDVRSSIENWYHNHTPRVKKKAIPAGKNPLWEAFTKRKVSPSRLYIKRELAEVLKGTGGKKDIGLIAKVAAQQYSHLSLEQRQKWEKEAEEASKPREGQCYTNQLHAMPVFGDLFTKLIGPGDKQLGNCAFYLRFIYVDERGVSVEEEMCVSTNTLLEPYTSTPDPDWNRWSKDAVNPHASPIAADDEEAQPSSPIEVSRPSPHDSSPVVSSASASSTSEPPLSQDPVAVQTTVIMPNVSLTIPASTIACPSTPMSVQRTRRVENIPDLPALNRVESVEWLRVVVQSHLENQWREAGWESVLDWTIIEGDRERYLMCASFWQRYETLCPMKLELLPCMSFYNDLAAAWNLDKTSFFKDARDASHPTPRRRVVSITPRTPRTPQTPSRLSRPRVGDIQLPPPLTLARAVLSRRSSTSTLPSTPQRHRESSGLDLDPADFIPMDSMSLGLTHVYAENNNLPAPWELLDSTTSAAPTSTRSPAPIPAPELVTSAPAATAGVNVDGDAAPTSTRSPAPIPAPELVTSAPAATAGVNVNGDTAPTSTRSPAPILAPDLAASAPAVEGVPRRTPEATDGINGDTCSIQVSVATAHNNPATVGTSPHHVAVPAPVLLGTGIAPDSAGDKVPKSATRGRGRGRSRGHGRGYGQVVGGHASIGRTTRSQMQNAVVNADTNGANQHANTSATANANADSANGANDAHASAGARHPSGSFKLKLTNNTTILAMTGAPPQHVVRVAGATEDGMKRKRKESDSEGSRKRARVNDENDVQLAESGHHSRPQRNRAPARPRSAMPSKAS